MPELEDVTLVCLNYFLAIDCCKVQSLLHHSVPAGFSGQFSTQVEHFSHGQGLLKSEFLYRPCELPGFKRVKSWCFDPAENMILSDVTSVIIQ